MVEIKFRKIFDSAIITRTEYKLISSLRQGLLYEVL